jgi:hypothetical protein
MYIQDLREREREKNSFYRRRFCVQHAEHNSASWSWHASLLFLHVVVIKYGIKGTIILYNSTPIRPLQDKFLQQFQRSSLSHLTYARSFGAMSVPLPHPPLTFCIRCITDGLSTNFMEHSPSWEAASRSATQKFPSTLWDPKVPYCVYKRPSLAMSLACCVVITTLITIWIALVGQQIEYRYVYRRSTAFKFSKLGVQINNIKKL